MTVLAEISEFNSVIKLVIKGAFFGVLFLISGDGPVLLCRNYFYRTER